VNRSIQEKITMTKVYKGIETKLIHAGEPAPLIGGAVSMPIFQSSTFEYKGQENYHDLRYIRLNNTPNHVALHQKMAALENAENALVTASGMASISATLLTLLVSGDHMLAQDCLYAERTISSPGTYPTLASLATLSMGTNPIHGKTNSNPTPKSSTWKP
jgi:cystathionine beta-lyase/cystathionine gamma-synthase